jgi:hypothetical protein
MRSVSQKKRRNVMGLRESLNKLTGHFEVKKTDAPDVKAYKETMLEGFNSLSGDVQDLDALTCCRQTSSQHDLQSADLQSADSQPDIPCSPAGADRANVEGS